MTINDKIIIHGIGMEGSPNRQGLLKLLKESGMTFQVVQENTHEFNEIQKLRK